MSVCGLVRQHVRGVFLCGSLGESVGCASVEDARTEESGETGRHVAAFAKGVLPLVRRAFPREIHVRMRDLARLVQREVEAVRPVRGVGREDCVARVGCEAMRRVWFSGI